MNNPVVRRYRDNPILTKDDVPYQVSTIHNAGAAKHDGKYILLFRSHLHNGRSVIGLAESRDGYSFSVGPEPFLAPDRDGPFAEFEEYGVEDCRICPMPGEGYLLTYSAYSRYGVRVMLARTEDFMSVKKIAAISQADMRNLVIFPRKFGEYYVRLDRPHTGIAPWSIWISYSPDLVHWGNSRLIMKPQQYHWDEMKIGPGATPIRTDAGWLHIYHGVFSTMPGAVYRLGVALHALDDPSRILGVSDDWILQPERPWEITGYVPNVVFTCGAITEEDGAIRLYWGGADSVICTGTTEVSDLVQLCLHKSRSAV